jgi:hypothetical protein
VFSPTYGVAAIIADREYDVGPSTAANAVLSPGGKLAFAHAARIPEQRQSRVAAAQC